MSVRLFPKQLSTMLLRAGRDLSVDKRTSRESAAPVLVSNWVQIVQACSELLFRLPSWPPQASPAPPVASTTAGISWRTIRARCPLQWGSSSAAAPRNRSVWRSCHRQSEQHSLLLRHRLHHHLPLRRHAILFFSLISSSSRQQPSFHLHKK